MRLLYLAICSFLIASSLIWTFLFAVMALGGSWHEPNATIAILEIIGSLLLAVLGFTGWLLIVKHKVGIARG